MTNKLFRKESLEGAYVKVAGEVIIGQNIGFRIFGYIYRPQLYFSF